jgi:deazaflavin-dependent oxidoreductase (nitroreductase family)
MEEDGPETGSEARGAHPKARGKVILIASNFGGKQHPAWYYNLKANPHASLSIGEYKGEYLAHEATGEEREACWERAAFLYGGYNAYRLRAGHRTIGVFVLTPYEGG